MPADWPMFWITVVYVIATCLICYFNHQSAKASREQLVEMRKQYKDENRPSIEIEFIYERRTWYIVRFVNHGKLTAQNVSIQLSQDFIDSLPEESIRSALIKQRNKKCIIGVGQHHDLFIGSNKLRGNPNMLPVTGVVTYQSNGEQYSSDIYIDLENYVTFFSTDNEHDDLMKVLKGGKRELQKIAVAIEKLNSPKEEN